MKKIYSLHEYGAPSHLYALDELAKKNELKLVHRELNIYGQLKGLIKKPKFKKFKKLLVNVYFLLSLNIQKDKVIVIGIAPYNYRLKYLLPIIRNHNVFYFSSYTCWDQSRMAHSKFYTKELLEVWRNFIANEVKHIFAISEKTKKELVRNNFSSADKITVVNHSYRENFKVKNSRELTRKFIYVGRMIEQKGISELLEIFAKRTDCDLTLIGKGDLDGIIKTYTNTYKNINYLGYVDGFHNIISHYTQHSFLLMNSKRNSYWEELFGIAIIEGMACGLVPIATNHPGPIEIITNGVDGFICEEGAIESKIDEVLSLDKSNYRDMRKKAIEKASNYRSEVIAERWRNILKYV